LDRPDHSRPVISVVIATFARPADLRRALESIGRCAPAPDEVVVVDGDPDGSAHAVVETLSGSIPNLRYVHTEAGLTKQRNRGAVEASGTVIVYLDDDVVVGEDLFTYVASAYEDPSVVGMTGKVVEEHGGRLLSKGSGVRRALPGGGREGSFTRFGYPRRVLEDRKQHVEFMQGCFMTATREETLAVGFDETLAGYALAEDEDFSYRLSRKGTIVYDPRAVVRHNNSGFSHRDQRAFDERVVLVRAYLFRKNFERTLLARMQFGLLILMLLAHRLLNREWAGARGIVVGATKLIRGRA
jgi:GT2 family glycosyltransferase